jgi:chromosome segregation ATPase
VNTREQPFNLNFQFWTVLGPLILLSALAPALFAPVKNNFIFPLITFAGFILCWRWKTGGLAAAIVLSFGLLAYLFNSIPQDERFWQLGITLAIALSFVVFTLSVEEAQAIDSLLQLDFSSKKDDAALLERKMSEIESASHAEKESLRLTISGLELRIEGLENRIREGREELAAYEKKIALMREEKSGLMADAQQKRNEALQLQKQLQEMLAEKSQLITASKIFHDEKIAFQTQVTELQGKVMTLNHKIEELKFMVANAQEEALHSRKEAEVYSNELAQLNSRQAAFAAELPAGDESLEALKKEKHNLECLLKQLRNQFEEKSHTLSQARSELFHTKEKLSALQRDKEEAELFSNNPHIAELEARLAQALTERENAVEEVKTMEQIVSTLMER